MALRSVAVGRWDNVTMDGHAEAVPSAGRDRGHRMKPLTVVMFVGCLFCPVSLSAQVNPVNDFSGGLSVFTIGGDATDATRHTPIGWQASVSQRIENVRGGKRKGAEAGDAEGLW